MTPAARRHVVVTLVLALLAGIAVATPPFDTLRGLSLDVLTALRWQAFGNAEPPAVSPAVVLALDEETYHSHPSKARPTSPGRERSAGC